jgi:knotted carbamoyltransferase YgeW
MNTEKTELLQDLDFNLKNKNLLLTWEHSLQNLKAIVTCAELLKELHYQKKHFKIFHSGLAVSIFRDKSTRTRFSFASAANALGLAVQELDEKTSQISHGESVRETANMISFLTEVVGIRDDMFIGVGDRYQRQFAEAVKFGFKNGILAQLPMIINLQSDIDHPTQSLADLTQLKQHFGGFDQIRDRKIVMSWAYSPSYGKPLSVAQGMIGLLTRFGADVTLAHPEGYDLLPEVVSQAEKQTAESGGKFTITNNMKEAFQAADVVCPKSWAPINVMQRRSEYLQNGDIAALERLEQECLAENEKHIAWECNREMMSKTNNALYMHPLPADITGFNCEHGEVSKDVFDNSIHHTYTQAGFKPFVIAAMILLAKAENPVHTLKTFAEPRLRN